jgi:tetratricopeptide (TPR) repeat protein
MPTLVLRLALVGLLAAAAVPAAIAADSPATKEGPDLSAVRASIKVKNYDAALGQLKAIVVNYPQPDVYSLMGFALRKTGDRAQAMTYYRKALDADPTHKGALEYQGELYVELGQVDKAKENLARLGKLCWFGCEEQRDLKEAIEHAPRS